MKALIAFFSKTGITKEVALVFSETLKEKKLEVELFEIKPKKELKAYEYKKFGKNVELKTPLVDVKEYDLIFLGTPVWDFSPTPIVLSYLNSLKNLEGKKFVLFSTCLAVPGTTIKKMSNFVSTHGGQVLTSFTLKTMFNLDLEKKKAVKAFAEEAVSKI